jgi:hypothetical protein
MDSQLLAHRRRGPEDAQKPGMWFCLDTSNTCAAAAGSALPRPSRNGAEAQTRSSPSAQDHPGRPRPTRARARDRMIAYLHKLHDREATDWIVQHAQSPEDAAALVEEGTAIFGKDPPFCTQVGPVLGAHLGSGMLVGGIGCTIRPR